MNLPPVVCICGSARFAEEIVDWYGRLTDEGSIVLSLGRFMSQAEQTLRADHKAMLDRLHLAKIDLADYVFLVDVGGYVGESTTRELMHAHDTGKPIRCLSTEVGSSSRTPGQEDSA